MEKDAQLQLYQLQQQLAAREQEVAALREIAEAATELQSQDVQAAKVIELSKKNRSLNLLLEKERQKVAKLQQSVSELSANKEHHSKPGNAAGGPDEGAIKELNAAKERLQQMTNKNGLMEQKIFLLDGENKKLMRALVREVGDDIPLSKVLNDGSDWKGRREQIVHLKDTIRQLKEAADVSAGAATTGVPSSLTRHETAYRSVIGKLSKERAAEMERMASELDESKRAAEQLRLQAAGLTSRKKVLETEVSDLKGKLAVVLQKTQHDDKLISALRGELAAVGKGGSSPGSVSEVFQLRETCSQLEDQVEQQQKVIRHLQAQQARAGDAAANGLSRKAQQLLEQLQDENEQLKQQEDNAQLHALLEAEAARGSPTPAVQRPVTLQLTESQKLVLEAAKEAVFSDSGLDPSESADAHQDVPDAMESIRDMEEENSATGDTKSSACITRRGAFAARPAFKSCKRTQMKVVAEKDAAAPTSSGIEKTGPSFKPVLDIEAIKGVLPHRYPFLLVDRVVEVEYGKSAVGYKNITVNDQFFNGHFPERAIMPGVLQIEAMAQLGGLVMLDPANQEAKEQFFFGGIEGCRFRKPVVPGDTLMMHVTVTKYNKRFGIVKMAAKGYVGPDLAVEAELTLAMGKAS
eukprot:gene12960-13089_t